MKMTRIFPPLESLQRFLQTPNGRRSFRIGTRAIGAAAIAAFIWFAAPSIGFGSFRPFEEPMTRLIAIFIELIVIGIVLFQDIQQRKSAAEHLAKALSGEDSDAPVLAERMKEALSTLRSRAGGRGNYLYDLPWYVLIGPPGSGKTTALVNSGLKFPVLKGGHPGAIAGVGGTRYCDWWFTEDAVLIDTAGRYTTQDSDASADQASWRAFLNLLKRYRPKQPINGVLVAISLEDLLTLPPEEITAHADAIRARILELNHQLDLDFPVYALFTKADLVIGFMEFFDDLNERGRAQVWGTTFRSKEKRQNPLGQIEAEFDALVRRVHSNVPRRLETEKNAGARVLIFGFPAQLAALKQQINDFLQQIFDPARYQASAPLRGFYFTSGTQQGTPIDKLLGALSKSFAAEGVTAPVYSGRGKSFFLTDLVKNVIIGEAGFVSNNLGRKLGAVATFATVFILTPLIAGFFWISYAHNGDIVQDSKRAAARYTSRFGNLNTTGNPDLLDKVLPALDDLRKLPRGYDSAEAEPETSSDFGLDQAGRLHAAAQAAYRNGLEQLLRPRLLARVEEQLRASTNDTNALYDALKVYLMLGGQRAVDRQFLLGWMETDWSQRLYPDARDSTYATKRLELEKHVATMVDLNASGQPAVAFNKSFAESAQKALLARLDVGQRVFDILQKRASDEQRDPWVASKAAGNGGANFFTDETLRAASVPYFYTRDGFEKAFIGRVEQAMQDAKNDKWVLGPSADNAAMTTQFDKLPQNLARLYANAYIGAWRSAIDKLQVQNLIANERPSYRLLGAAAQPPTALATLLESIRRETSLTDLPAVRGSAAGSPAAQAISGNRDLQAYHNLVPSSGTRPIDTIVADFREIQKFLRQKATTNPPDDKSSSRVTEAVNKLSADSGSLPQPFQRMMQTIVADVKQENGK